MFTSTWWWLVIGTKYFLLVYYFETFCVSSTFSPFFCWSWGCFPFLLSLIGFPFSSWRCYITNMFYYLCCDICHFLLCRATFCSWVIDSQTGGEYSYVSRCSLCSDKRRTSHNTIYNIILISNAYIYLKTNKYYILLFSVDYDRSKTIYQQTSPSNAKNKPDFLPFETPSSPKLHVGRAWGICAYNLRSYLRLTATWMNT